MDGTNPTDNPKAVAASASLTSTTKKAIDIDPVLITQWLDNHPEFLNDYLRKKNLQRRISVINDNNRELLLNINSHHSQFSHHLNPTSSNASTSDLNTASNKLNHIHDFFTSFGTREGSKSTQYYAGSSSIVSTMPGSNLMYKTANNLNTSIMFNSVPNIQPAENNDNINFAKFKTSIQQQLVNRKKFKQLSLYEKMYTLVKTLYQSLDLKSTCKKILNTVSLLLDADRCSLFLVVDELEDANNINTNNNKFIESSASANIDSNSNFTCLNNNSKCLISVVFDAQSNNMNYSSTSGTSNESDNKINYDKIKIPYGKGIAGYVAATGETLNIPDAYKDPRFNSNIDLQTGYRTRSILCLPILNEHGQCIAVAEAINKLNDTDSDSQETANNNNSSLFFTKEDEEIFSKFMPFIAIAIRNSDLYSQSIKEAQTNKVLLELATIVFDESSTTVDNLVSRILFNSIFLLECERCQVILLNNASTIKFNSTSSAGTVSTSRPIRRASFNTINKYFDRIYELNYNDLNTSNEAFTNGIIVKPSVPSFTLDSPELEIISTVIQSGEILNIPNMKHDPKYNNFSNNASCLLCIPVMNSSDQVVALIFACNKLNNATLNYFSQSDINVAQSFALFCGIGIQNIMMYEKVVRAMNMQQVALDVLSYHVSSSQDECDRLIDEQIMEPYELGLISFGFDENTLDDIGTLKACISMFADLGLVEKFNIPYDVLCRFFLTVKKNYRPVAYHNWRHGFNVMASMYAMLTLGSFRNTFDDLEMFSLLIACICHDLDHRGTTNKFQIKIQSPLAKLYTTSTMEHHHFNQCIIILHNNNNNILMNLTSHQHSIAIDLIERAILATDLALHFQHFDKFYEKAHSNNCRFETPDEKDLLLHMLMTACDLSGGAKPWKCHQRLSNLVSNEFFNEGDLEKEKFKNEPIDSMNRNKIDQLPQMQIQFIQSVCLPLYEGFALCNPLLQVLVDECENNVKEWQKLIKSNANRE